MSDATLDDRGRLTLPKEIRERYGDRYYIVELHDGIKLIPVADDPPAHSETSSGASRRPPRSSARGHARWRWTRPDAECTRRWISAKQSK
jgi:hypothetical protein